ncbi:sugar phosphate isomerase/epimerase family protein [Caldisericum exile]|uniref:Xylose isomerase-like TIM barrel domain-containing protein n=1 Tax=Caldisericum exile (strain DSM 21853 / NBRC 104410 / AZM16c01) TaxID=511051 RepID=A0A7U6GFM0_CALEA|nr:TIM barrel protein [Caldisericum exile]BAL81496.1 hypothetical protein CSE_13700 [Caldisericum exile AZM16c01]
MIKFGFSYSEELTFKDVENLYREGLTCVEVNARTPQAFIEFAKKISFEITFHVTFLKGFNPSFPTESIRKSAVSEIFKELDYARSIGATNITLHGGYITWFDFIDPKLAEFDSYVKIAENERRLHLDALRKSVKEILSGNGDLTISIENLYFPFELMNNPYELKRFVYTVDNLFVTLDFGHAKISKFKIFDYVSLVSSRITKLHLHTNDGIYDLHRPIEANIDDDFKDSLIVINNLKNDVIGIIELHRDFSAISKSFKNIKNLLGGGAV